MLNKKFIIPALACMAALASCNGGKALTTRDEIGTQLVDVFDKTINAIDNVGINAKVSGVKFKGIVGEMRTKVTGDSYGASLPFDKMSVNLENLELEADLKLANLISNNYLADPAPTAETVVDIKGYGEIKNIKAKGDFDANYFSANFDEVINTVKLYVEKYDPTRYGILGDKYAPFLLLDASDSSVKTVGQNIVSKIDAILANIGTPSSSEEISIVEDLKSFKYEVGEYIVNAKRQYYMGNSNTEAEVMYGGIRSMLAGVSEKIAQAKSDIKTKDSKIYKTLKDTVPDALLKVNEKLGKNVFTATLNGESSSNYTIALDYTDVNTLIAEYAKETEYNYVRLKSGKISASIKTTSENKISNVTLSLTDLASDNMIGAKGTGAYVDNLSATISLDVDYTVTADQVSKLTATSEGKDFVRIKSIY